MSSEALDLALSGAARSFRPPPVLAYSDWVAQSFYIESAGAIRRFKLWKFQKQIADVMGDRAHTRVTVVKPVQVGYTTLLAACIGADAANDPTSVIVYVPTDEDARKIMVDDIDPGFRNSPALQAEMRVGRYDGRNTLVVRAFTGGGTLKVLGTNSARNMRSHRARKLYLDEVDAMVVTKEGDPVELAENRTNSFPDRKIVVGSTPVGEGESFVWKRYEQSDQRIFEVPCKFCGVFFEMLWKHVEWPKGKPREAVVVCPHCANAIDHRFKVEMIEAGDWHRTKPDVEDHAGFKMNALISLQPTATWGALAEKFEEAKKSGPSGLQPFRNTVEGLPWSTTIDQVNEHHLMARAAAFGLRWDEERQRWDVRIPVQVLYITVGVDVQPDRLEVVLVGWSRDQRWFLGHEILRGDTGGESLLWNDLDAMLLTRWRHPLGGDIGVEATAIDSGDGNRTQAVYDFCGPRTPRRIIPIKGDEGPRPFIKATTSKRARRAGARLHIVGVDGIKMDLITSTQIDPGEQGALQFADVLSNEFFIQFTSERRKVDIRNGRAVTKFVRIGNRQAEALDGSCYAIAVRNICRFDFDRRETELAVPDAPKPDPNAALRAALGRKKW
ncbi:phage terminase large subunit family protein [Ancylobacter amanitiformis]|uniref:Phage terminase large subunit GpA-like protein n=1 Tax=Ancylobacter amanitiformis TaxID=217069 RepID=A0ABU0LQA9_9HYPH|nr:terminase gpA endonuclease subunit [Ancylobacter amanitiformis]MDQ0510891.1 phage terminase large subunit GpA-like protein [Ancylobacter amanitiformis]